MPQLIRQWQIISHRFMDVVVVGMREEFSLSDIVFQNSQQ